MEKDTFLTFILHTTAVAQQIKMLWDEVRTKRRVVTISADIETIDIMELSGADWRRSATLTANVADIRCETRQKKIYCVEDYSESSGAIKMQKFFYNEDDAKKWSELHGGYFLIKEYDIHDNICDET